MLNKIPRDLGRVALSTFAIGALLLSTSAPVLAGNGNGNGNGNSNAGGNSRASESVAERGNSSRGNSGSDTRLLVPGNGNGKGNGNANGNNGNGQAQRLATTTDPAVEDDTALTGGKLRSAMGALNAAHASEQAMANASPNSRVGKIATYRQAVLDSEATVAELVAARETLEGLETPERDLPAIYQELGFVRDDLDTYRTRLAEIDADLRAGTGDQEALLAERATVLGDIADARADGAELLAERDDTLTYRDTTIAVRDLTDEVDALEENALTLLDAAANKPVTDDVLIEVNRLLGIETDLFDPDLDPVEDPAVTAGG